MPFGVVTEWGRSSDWCIRWGEHRGWEGAALGVNVGHPIVANRDFVALLCYAVRGGDAAFPELVWDFLLYVVLEKRFCN